MNIVERIANDPNVCPDLRRILAHPERTIHAHRDPVKQAQMHIRHYKLHMAHDDFRILGCGCRGCSLALANLRKVVA